MARQIGMREETQKVKSKKGKVIHTAEKTPAGSLQPITKSVSKRTQTSQQNQNQSQTQNQNQNTRQAFRQMVSQTFGGTSPVTAAPRTASDRELLSGLVRQTMPDAYRRTQTPMDAFVQNRLGESLGQYGKGNIDLYNRPQYRQRDGSISTVNSMSFGDESGKEILVPTIGRDANGRPVQLTEDQAIDQYYKTGQYLGKFDSIDEADKYADQLHRQQEAYYDDSQLRALANQAPRPFEVGGAVRRFQQTGEMNITPELKKMMDEAPESGQGIRSSTQEEVNAAADWTKQRVENANKAQSDRELRTFDRHNPIIAGALQGTGIPSMLTAGEQALARLTGNEEAQKQSAQMYENELREAQGLQERHPYAFGAGSLAGNIGTMALGGELLGGAAEGIKAPKLAVRAITGGILFGGSTAAHQAGSLATGLMSGTEFARNVGVSTVSGAAQSAAAMATAVGLEDLLRRTGSQTLFLDWVKNLSSATAGAGTRIGIEYAMQDKTPTDLFRKNYMAMHPEATEEDLQKAYTDSLRQQAAVQFGTAFAMNLLSATMDTYKTNSRNFSWLKKQYEDLEKDIELAATMRPANSEDLDSWQEAINNRTQTLRETLQSNYFGGQQDKVDAMTAALDAIDARAADFVAMQRGTNTFGASAGTGTATGTGTALVPMDLAAAIDQAMKQGVAEAQAQPPAVPGMEQLRALAAPPTETSEAQIPSTDITTGAVTAQRDIPGNPYTRTAMQDIDGAARQIQAAQYERSQYPSVEQLNDELNSPFAVFENETPEITANQSRAGAERLAALADARANQQAQLQEGRRQALINSGVNQDSSYVPTTDRQPLERFVNRLAEQDQTAQRAAQIDRRIAENTAAIEAIRAEARPSAVDSAQMNGYTQNIDTQENLSREAIGYGTGEPESNLSGEGSRWPVSLSAGERNGSIPSAAGVPAESSWRAGKDAADPEAGTLRFTGEVPATQIFPEAEPGQVIHLVSSGTTPSVNKGGAVLKAAGAKKVTYYGSDNDIATIRGEQVRASVNLDTGEVNIRVNDPNTTAEQQSYHEAVEIGVGDGRIVVADAMKHLKSSLMDMGIDAAGADEIITKVSSLYQQGNTTPEGMAHANKEMVCDGGARINQFDGVEGYEDAAAFMQVISDILHPYCNEKLGGAFDAEAEDAPVATMEGVTPEQAKALETVNTVIDTKDGTANALPIQYSADLWNESQYVKERAKAIETICQNLNVSKEQAEKYIDDVNSVAKMIIADRGRYDYKNSGLSPFVSNAEYGGSFDFDTLCPKRGPFIGTFQAIQELLPNTALTRDEVLAIRKMMDDNGLEVPCGKCYVEGSRAAMGEFTKKFLELYKKYYPENWQPNMAQANTPDGIEWIRLTHPECYEQYEYFWNHYGTLKPGDPNLFASQQKPKLYMSHSAYSNEILREFKNKLTVIEKNRNGGIRFQSFSDCEIIHIIDAMQAIMDMSVVGLNGQGYTKQPNFAAAFGDTGLKINLSIDAWGFDEDGKLIFNSKEGMPFETAMELRNKHSKNVGTICCVYDDKMLLAALADDRIDFIIPFHRSQWKKSQYKAMGLPSTTKDYTYQQNEKWLDPSKHTHEYRGRQVKTKCLNYMPNDYWDFSKSGKENAEKYLDMCYRDGKRPKFYKFLDKTMVDGKAKFSLKKDGSTDGYWKLLIDFKMYDNDGVGSPQMPVRPNFDMQAIQRMFAEYAGDHHSYPVAKGIVDQFVADYKKKHPGIQYSSKLNLDKKQKRDAEYSVAVRDNDTETANRLVREAAADAGYTEELYHGTGAFGFTRFDLGKMDDGASIFATSDRSVAESYSGVTKRELISQRAGESDDDIIDRIDGTKDEDLLPLIRESLDSKYERVPQERLSEMRDERVNDIRFYADKIMDFMDDNPGMFDEAKSIAASRLASSMYKLSRAQSADEVDEYLRQYNDDAWELKFMDEDAFYEIFDGGSGITATNNAIRELNTLLESDVMFTNGKRKPGSTLDVLTPGEARTELIGEMSKGIYHLYGKKENMLEFDANGDNWNMIDTARISNKAFRIKSASSKDKAWLSGLYMPYNDAQSLAARATRDANGEDDYLDVKDLRDPLGKISGWEFRSHKTGEMVMELESALPSRAMTRDIAKYAREVGYDGVIMRNLRDSGGATPYNHASDVYIYFNPNAVKSADTVTYDDGGNAIPLSERFKSGEEDIRYSTKLKLQGKMVELTEREEKLMEQLSNSYLERIEQVTAQKDAQIAELKEKMKVAVGAEKEKARQRIEKLRQEKNDRIAYLEKQWRQNTNWRIAELKKKAETKLGEQHDDMIRRLANLQAQKDKKIDEILAAHRAQKQAARDKRNDRKLRVKFQKLAQKALRESRNKPGLASERVQELLKDIDLTALGMTDTTRISLHNKLLEIMEMRKTDENYLALHAEDDWKKVERLFKKQIKDMSLEEVSDMITELSALSHYQETTDRLLRDEQNRSAAEVGRQIVQDLKELTPLDVTNPVKVMSAKYLRDNLSPERAFNRLSGYKRDSAMKSLYRQVLDGYTRVKTFEKMSSELFERFEKDEKNKDFLKNGAKQTIPITSKYGQTALISPAMRVSLYMASKNRDNQRHIATDGMTVPEPSAYAKGLIEDAYGRGTTIILDPADINKICADMTESEKEFASLLETFFDGYAKDAINETSVDLDGVLKAIVDNYFPISSDKNFLAKSMDNFQDPTLEGWNNLKKRQEGANNKILLEDARQVLQRHIRNTARYYGLAIPLRNWNKVYGYTSHRDEFTGTRNSVQSAIKNAWNSDTADYIERLIRDDINAGGRKAERGVLDAMRSAYAGSTLTLNASVALKQTTSYAMAGSIIDTGSLMYGLAHRFTKADEQYMDSITPWGWARRQGQSTIELGEMAKKQDPITKNTPNLNQAMDVWTTNRLFLATEESVRKEFPDLHRGDKKYDETLAERYNQVLWRTQPQYEAAFRPEYLRKTDIGSRTFGMFKTESMQMSGELIDAWGQWKADEKRAKNGSETAAKYSEESAKNFYKTLASWTASNLTFALMGTALNILLFHKGKPYRNEKGEIDFETLLKKTGLNFLSSAAGGFFGASSMVDFATYIYSALKGEKSQWYDIEAPGLSLINDLINNMGNMIGTMGNEEASTGAKAQAISKFALSVSKFTPIGFAENIVNLANSVVLYNQDLREGTMGRWEAGKGLLKDTSPTRDQYANMAVDAARKGDMEKAARALKKTKKANLEKAVGRPITENMYKRINEDPNNLRSYLGVALDAKAPSIRNVPDHGYSSFTKLREDLGDPERTQNWHHIVEQEQMEKSLSGFTSTQVNNTNNIVSIPSGSKSPHAKISEYYGSVQDFTGGKTVREWLKGKSFEEQWEFGVKQLREYGDLVPTDSGWVFVPDKEKIESKIPMNEGTAKEKTDTQRTWESRIAEAREDGGVTRHEAGAIALEMLANGVTTDEIKELYKKTDKKVGQWKDGTFEDYLKGRDAVDAARSIQDKDKKQQTEKRKKYMDDYLGKYKGSYDDELLLWKLAGFSENTFNYH